MFSFTSTSAFATPSRFLLRGNPTALLRPSLFVSASSRPCRSIFSSSSKCRSFPLIHSAVSSVSQSIHTSSSSSSSSPSQAQQNNAPTPTPTSTPTPITTSTPAPFPSATELRSHTCGQLTDAHVGQSVTLCGWAHAVRDTGAVLFLLLRDRHGIVQATISETTDPSVISVAKSVRLEYVVRLTGIVSLRDASAVNPSMATGTIEIDISSLQILSKTSSLPFMIADHQDDTANDDTRLKHRYLDLRRPPLLRNFVIRHDAMLNVRNYLNASEFLEIETPILTKATPEGARDYLVPSRVHKGCWYALPQSPQIYKQLLMVSGMDRYFQIARCFRDEDLRFDRQPEFTQIDLEMSFAGRKSIMAVAHGILASMLSTIMSNEEASDIVQNIPVLSYHDAINRFGVDAPDMRFNMELSDVTDHPVVQSSTFAPVANAVALEGGKGCVKAFVVKEAATDTSRKRIDQYTAFVKDFGLSGLLFGKVQEDGSITGPLSKLASSSEQQQHSENDIASLLQTLSAASGDLVLMACGPSSCVNPGLGKLRVKVANERELISKRFAFCWVVDFPLFEQLDDNTLTSVHHPFTAPIADHVPLLMDMDAKDLGSTLSDSYDLVCNGAEIGGGSVRIHQPAIQQRVFDVLGIAKDEQREKFGFLLDALAYGAPPHAGMAFGLDRCVMILTGAQGIRDVVAFPKTTRASDIMAGAPTPVPQPLLDELAVRTQNEDSDEEEEKANR